jgi:hypothetical protein
VSMVNCDSKEEPFNKVPSKSKKTKSIIVLVIVEGNNYLYAVISI